MYHAINLLAIEYENGEQEFDGDKFHDISDFSECCLVSDDVYAYNLCTCEFVKHLCLGNQQTT